MLEDNYSTAVNELLDNFDCDVAIPDNRDEYFTKQGMLPPVDEDRRRFARKHYRTKAILEIRPTLPWLSREQAIFAVYTRDISRAGISFLHTAQLYPGETCRLWLPDRRIRIDVVSERATVES